MDDRSSIDRAQFFLRQIKKEQFLIAAIFFATAAVISGGIWLDPRIAGLTLFFYIPIVLAGIYFQFRRAIYLYVFITAIYFSFVGYYFNILGNPSVARILVLVGEIGTFYLIGFLMHRLHKIAYLAYREIFDQAMEDPLTGVFNKRYFDLILDHEIREAKRYKNPLTLIFLDIDGLKKYNDRFGHPTVDLLICQFADLLEKLLRSADVLCRWGGDEFTVILPHTNERQSLLLAKRIRLKIIKHTFRLADRHTISNFSVSMGLASYPHSAHDKKGMIEQADMALYRAKKTRERIILLPPIE